MVRPCRSSCARRRVSPDGGACTGRDVPSFARLRLRHDAEAGRATALQHRRRARAPAARRGGGRRPARGRGAARAADRRRARGRDDAHARATTRSSRSGSRSRRGCARSAPRPGRPGREHDRARGARVRPRPAGAVVLHDVVVRRLRQGRARGDRGRVAAGREHADDSGGAPRDAARPAPRGAGRVRLDGRAPRDRPLHAGRRARVRARGRRPPQRDGQGDRARLPRRAPAALAITSSASAGGSRSSSSRRQRSPAARSSSRSGRRRRSPSSSPRTGA